MLTIGIFIQREKALAVTIAYLIPSEVYTMLPSAPGLNGMTVCSNKPSFSLRLQFNLGSMFYKKTYLASFFIFSILNWGGSYFYHDYNITKKIVIAPRIIGQ